MKCLSRSLQRALFWQKLRAQCKCFTNPRCGDSAHTPDSRADTFVQIKSNLAFCRCCHAAVAHSAVGNFHSKVCLVMHTQSRWRSLWFAARSKTATRHKSYVWLTRRITAELQTSVKIFDFILMQTKFAPPPFAHIHSYSTVSFRKASLVPTCCINHHDGTTSSPPAARSG